MVTVFHPAIIQLTVWTYARFTLSFRDVEELLAERGLDMSYETVRRWLLKFGQVYARSIRRCGRIAVSRDGGCHAGGWKKKTAS